MSHNPFEADPSAAARYAVWASTVGPELSAEVARFSSARDFGVAGNLGSVVLAAEVQVLVARYGLNDPRDVMILALDAAKRIARPPVSNFVVGAIGLERETGDLVLGGNVEFPGTHLGLSLHGEGFFFTRSFSRRTTISVIAIGEAHPCGHCRQYLSEFAAARDLELVDPHGHRLSMAQLYPWPFDPSYLGEPGLVTAAVPFSGLHFTAAAGKAEMAERLLTAGRRAHAPYSRCPSAVVLRLDDGALIAGSAIESVAFNPSIGPLQAAVVDLLAHGYGYGAIAECWLGTVREGAVDHEKNVSELLGRIAPAATMQTFDWRP